MKGKESVESMTELILTIFYANGIILKWGDELTEEFGMTSSRWQVMGAVRNGPAPVADIARTMGLQRQSVQRTVDLLHDSGDVRFLENPAHKRAKLVDITEQGNDRYAKIMKKYESRVKELVRNLGLDFADAKKTSHLIKQVVEQMGRQSLQGESF